MSIRVLTGIKPTGTPHLGNYVGAIRPGHRRQPGSGHRVLLFLADYHALAGSADAERVHRSTLEVAASWLAAGLDPGACTSTVSPICRKSPELTWLLSCVTAKGCSIALMPTRPQ